jgi:hypothetical protein
LNKLLGPPLLAAAEDLLSSYPLASNWFRFECDGDGLVILFDSPTPDAANFDYDPIAQEWDTGQFASAECGSFRLREDGLLPYVGEDDFHIHIKICHLSELPEIIEFQRNAQAHITQTCPSRRVPLSKLVSAIIPAESHQSPGLLCTDGKNNWELKPNTQIISATLFYERFGHATPEQRELAASLHIHPVNPVPIIHDPKTPKISIPTDRMVQIRQAIEQRAQRLATALLA